MNGHSPGRHPSRRTRLASLRGRRGPGVRAVPGLGEPKRFCGPAEGQPFGPAQFPCKRASSHERTHLRAPRVSDECPTAQTHKPTAPTKKTCKCRPFRERLMGFEPTTFCMASRTGGSHLARDLPANERVLGWDDRFAIPRLSPGNHGDLGTEWAPEPGPVGVGVRGRDRTIMSRAPRCERRISVGTRGREIPAKRGVQDGVAWLGAPACFRARGPVVDPLHRHPDIARARRPGRASAADSRRGPA
jgi:hypothetical protein